MLEYNPILCILFTREVFFGHQDLYHTGKPQTITKQYWQKSIHRLASELG